MRRGEGIYEVVMVSVDGAYNMRMLHNGDLLRYFQYSASVTYPSTLSLHSPL